MQVLKTYYSILVGFLLLFSVDGGTVTVVVCQDPTTDTIYATLSGSLEIPPSEDFIVNDSASSITSFVKLGGTSMPDWGISDDDTGIAGFNVVTESASFGDHTLVGDSVLIGGSGGWSGTSDYVEVNYMDSSETTIFVDFGYTNNEPLGGTLSKGYV